jgi:hypothetical protein
MKTDILFQEIQKQDQKWIWYLAIMVFGLVLFAFVQQVIFKRPFGTHPAPDWAFSIFFLIPVLFLILLLRTEMRTTICDEYLSFSYRPFFKKEKVFRWEDIQKCYVRIYSPVKEYGGWGIRPAIHKKRGKAYNVSGNKGIQLELKNGELVLIGTRKPAEAKAILNQIQKEL